MRVLGIDCGTEKTGFGVIDSDGLSHRLVTAGVINMFPHTGHVESIALFER